MIVPTARAARGRPACAASAPYVVSRPYGTCASSSSTVREKSLATAEVDRQVEVVPLTLEVLVQLAAHGVDCTRHAQEPRPEDPGELILGRVRVGVVRDPREAAVGRGHEQRPDGRVGDVVRHVQEPLLQGGLAKATVEVRRDCRRHQRCSFRRMRRTPEDAAWRAASALEPSASPIWA